MIRNDTVTYPPLIRMYFHERRSNKAMVAIPRATHPKPARNPAVAPQTALVFGSARNAARFADIISAKRNERLKIFAILLLARSSLVKLLTDIQARPNIAGEYQSPPSTNVEAAADRTASQLRCGMKSSPE